MIEPANIKKRERFEFLFHALGMGTLGLAGLLLVVLISAVSYRGFNALRIAEVAVVVDLSAASVDGEIDFDEALDQSRAALFPTRLARRERLDIARYVLAARANEQIEARANSEIKGQQQVWLGVGDKVDDYLKADTGTLPPFIQQKIEELKAENKIRWVFNSEFFTGGDSREPEHAGIYAALVGSIWLMLTTLLISFPIGVGAAIYLQEFSPKNRLSDLIEININNLASVPSIIFGLMGLAIFLNWFGLPRGSPLVGGMVLSLMTMPTIIIATRAALASVPPSIKEAALALGASQMQAVFHQVVPLALPGILTGAIIGMARALGETAPLLMIGMVAFIADPATSALDPSTALPVQIFIWADSPEKGFADKASAATIILLLFLISMNAAATYLRQRFTHRW